MAARVKRAATAGAKPERMRAPKSPEVDQSAGGHSGQETSQERALPPLKPGQCRAYMRRTLAREFRGIVDGFVKGAKRGSCQHVKLATELLNAPGRRRADGRGQVARLLEKLDREGL